MQVPSVLWAQREESVYLTVDLLDVQDVQIDLTETDLKFKGKVQGSEFGFEMKFFKSIDVEKSKYTQKRLYELYLAKKDEGM